MKRRGVSSSVFRFEKIPWISGPFLCFVSFGQSKEMKKLPHLEEGKKYGRFDWVFKTSVYDILVFQPWASKRNENPIPILLKDTILPVIPCLTRNPLEPIWIPVLSTVTLSAVEGLKVTMTRERIGPKPHISKVDNSL